jgi:hypothetical protein
MALDTMDDMESRKAVLNQVQKRCTCPVVSIRELIPGANNLLVDNTTCMEGIIQHFIEEHGFTRISFMTGPRNHWDAVERVNCFMREMQQHGLKVEDHNIFYGDFWKAKGKEACDWFLDTPERPQAIICANDYMALAVVSELIGRGVRVPEDICVSGYDGLDDTLNFTPSITTMTVPFEKMGRKAVRIIRDKQDTPNETEDYYFEAEVKRRESCGCIRGNKEEIVQTRREWHERNLQDRRRELQFCFMSIGLGECTTMDEIADKLSSYVYELDGFEKYGICLCDHLEEKNEFSGYTDTLELRMLVDAKEGSRGSVCIPFERKELIPEEASGEEPQIWYFSPLHFADNCFGYEAFRFEKNDTTGKLHLQWNTNIGYKIRDILSIYKTKQRIAELEQRMCNKG